MKSNSWFVAAALVLVPLAPIAGSTAPMADVIRVDGCAASAGDAQQSFMGPFHEMISQPSLPPMAMIDFSNVSNNLITSVEFGLVANGKLLAVVRDGGSFAPNARIMHAYGIAASAVPSAGTMAECVPLLVRYANGTTWMNPSMPAH